MTTTCEPSCAQRKTTLVSGISVYVYLSIFFICLLLFVYVCVREQAPPRVDDRMFHKHDLYRPLSVVEGQRQSHYQYYYTSTIYRGTRAHASKLILLEEYRLSQDKHHAEQDLLPCLSGGETHLSTLMLAVFLFFDRMFVCPPGVGLFFCNTLVVEEL